MASERNQGGWWSKSCTQTHTDTQTHCSGHGWEGSVCDCLKAEDALLEAGGNLHLVPHILSYVIPEGCRSVSHTCAGNVHWEVAQ